MADPDGHRSRKRKSKARDLRRTSLYLDAQDRLYRGVLADLLGLKPSEILRLALRTLAYKYGLAHIKTKGGK